MGLTFFPALLLRCPARPFNDKSLTPDLHTLLDDAAFMEAIHIASPVLHEQCQRYEAGTIDASRKKKLADSLTKYYNRMRSRPTPFGLFSGCSVLHWGEAQHVSIPGHAWSRHIRFDADFLCSLTEQLMEHACIRQQLHYRFNTSLYKAGHEYRYYEYQLEDHLRKYQVSAVPASRVLRHLVTLCSSAARSFEELCQEVVTLEEVEHTAALQYIETLILSQLLVSDLSFRITGNGFLDHVIQTLQQVHTKAPHETVVYYLSLLQQLKEHLHYAATAQCLPSALQKISDQLSQSAIPFRASRLFQIDCTLSLGKQTVDQQWQPLLIEALKALQILCAGNADSPWLMQLKEKFAPRYETDPVPLSHIADPDLGIISDKTANSIELDGQTPDVSISPPPYTDEHTLQVNDAVRTLLSEKLLQAFREDATVIFFTDNELEQLRTKVSLPPLPDTFSVMFSYVDEQHLFLENAGGASGVALIGRFGHTHEEIRKLLHEIHEFECSKNPSGILCDVVHLPEDRTGNILQHPVTRCYELPYLAGSSLPPALQLNISDLYLRLQQQTFQLYSLQHGRPVLPRIDNAHNYIFNTLPLYRLLGELQADGKQTGLTFSWNIQLPGICFYPRVQYKQVILCPAQWHLSLKHYQGLLLPGNTDAFPLFAARWKLPRHFVLANGDQHLLVDQDDKATIAAFIDAIREQQQLVLKEFLYEPESAILRDADHNAYVHQLIAIVKNDTVIPAQPDAAPVFHARQPGFALGSEWLYFKLYCSPHYADEVLIQSIAPVSKRLVAHGLIDKWFFIRYQDPEEHLRIRFHLTAVTHVGEVIQQMQQVLQPAAQDRFIWKIQTDTYYPEAERYGTGCMEDVERFFFIDSLHVLELLQLRNIGIQEAPLLLHAMLYMDGILQLFSFTLPQKISFASYYQEAFDREFDTSKDDKKIYNQYFRRNTQKINGLFDKENAVPQLFSGIIPFILKAHTGDLRDLAGDLLHMHVNRLFHVAQRKYEMVLYHLMTRYYRSLMARKG